LTKVLGVIGYPIEHSISPHLHNFILKKLNLDYLYLAFKVKPHDLSAAVAGVRALGIVGINVTIPHKEHVLQYVDDFSEEVRLVGSANTIHNDGDKLIAYNTDVGGFLRSLEVNNVELSGKKVVVLGAGGAARAIVHALVKAGVEQIVICNRTVERGQKLAADIEARTGFKHFSVLGLSEDLVESNLSEADLLVNTTSVGMFPRVEESPIKDRNLLHENLIVYDLVYNPQETTFLRMAKSAGARAINGLEMLIYQGIASLEIWTGSKISIDEFVFQLKDYLKEKL